MSQKNDDDDSEKTHQQGLLIPQSLYPEAIEALSKFLDDGEGGGGEEPAKVVVINCTQGHYTTAHHHTDFSCTQVD